MLIAESKEGRALPTPARGRAPGPPRDVFVVGQPRPWAQATVWLAGLAPFFYVTYGFANWFASQHASVGSFVFGWERAIPFWAPSIIPYWSINLFYAASLFVCTSRAELDTHVRRLVSAQITAVSFFVLLPLHFTFPRPEATGVAGFMFDALASFDKPFNQAPSLHIALLVILWVRYAKHVPAALHWLLHTWFTIIGVSVLTTYQHHFIDIPTGAALGWLCVWLWPEQGSLVAGARWTDDPRRRALARRYAAAALCLAVVAMLAGGAALILFWPVLSLLLVAAIYAAFGAAGFQKGGDGRLSPAALWLLGPYIAGAWINSRIWTRRHPGPSHAADGVWIGRMPTRAEWVRQGTPALIDLCAELPGPGGAGRITTLPLLDLVAPGAAELQTAVRVIKQCRVDGPVLVCCALGYSRSATAAAVWLLSTGRAPTAEAAISLIRGVRPRVVLDAETVRAGSAADAD